MNADPTNWRVRIAPIGELQRSPVLSRAAKPHLAWIGILIDTTNFCARNPNSKTNWMGFFNIFFFLKLFKFYKDKCYLVFSIIYFILLLFLFLFSSFEK